MNDQATHWRISQDHAELACHSMAGRIDLPWPARGLTNLSFDGRSISGHVLAAHFQSATPALDEEPSALTVRDAYVREADLVIVYDPTPNWPHKTEIYWRANNLANVRGVLSSLALMVSVETELLETCPRITIHSHLPRSESLVVTDDTVSPTSTFSAAEHGKGLCCIVQRFEGTAVSYAELVPKNDLRRVDVSEAGDVAWCLFGDFLEKGVIRRARIHSAVMPRTDDIEIARACIREISRHPLPLTA